MERNSNFFFKFTFLHINDVLSNKEALFDGMTDENIDMFNSPWNFDMMHLKYILEVQYAVKSPLAYKVMSIEFSTYSYYSSCKLGRVLQFRWWSTKEVETQNNVKNECANSAQR